MPSSLNAIDRLVRPLLLLLLLLSFLQFWLFFLFYIFRCPVTNYANFCLLTKVVDEWLSDVTNIFIARQHSCMTAAHDAIPSVRRPSVSAMITSENVL